MMTKEQIKQTKVWKLNDRLVIADSIPVAVEIYQAKYPYDEVEKIELIQSYRDCTYALINPDLFKEDNRE